MYRREHNMALVDVDNYLGNPINAFTLMKRLTIDLDFIEKTIKNGTGKARVKCVYHYKCSNCILAYSGLREKDVSHYSLHEHITEFVRDVTASSPDVYPTEEDLKGAAQALTRLQKTYKLDIRELAQGRLNGIVYR